MNDAGVRQPLPPNQSLKQTAAAVARRFPYRSPGRLAVGFRMRAAASAARLLATFPILSLYRAAAAGGRCLAHTLGGRNRPIVFGMQKPTQVIQRSPAILGGTPVFAGTRVPLQTLLDYLQEGQPLSTFLDDFPTVTREQAIAALQLAKDALLGDARSA